MHIERQLTTSPRAKVSADKLGFGKYFSDHMFLLDYAGGRWENARILPYGPLAIEPGASVLHYAQCLFEGMKAYRSKKNDKILLFRTKFNAERMADGCRRLCMPPVPVEQFVEGIRELVKVDKDWVPTENGASLYLRPTMIGTESYLGVRPAEKYLFFVITSPVAAYYSEGFNPVKIWVEEELIRAAPGGLGAIKAGANYAGSLKAFQQAKAKGYSQVLWLDAVEHKRVEEVGTMNVFFRLKDEIVTPPLGGTILPGATRDCVIELLKHWKLPIVERQITVEELIAADKKGELLEAFGTGTAAVISPVGELATATYKMRPCDGKVGELTQRLYDEILGIQYGERPDPFGWVEEV